MAAGRDVTGRGGMTVRNVAVGILILTISSIVPRSVSAQVDTMTLPEIEALAQHGRPNQARIELMAWWEGSRDAASREERQYALWLRGRLTVDPLQAVRDFQRLVIEYPGGPFTAGALYRLAQEAYERENTADFERYMASLSRDHPNASALAEAEAWVSGARLAAPTSGMRSTISRVEVENQSDIVMSPGIEAYSVQLGAFSNERRAAALFELALEAGLNVRLVRVPESSLIHVRTGHFDTSMEATVFSKQVNELGFMVAIVKDTQAEQLVRGGLRIPSNKL